MHDICCHRNNSEKNLIKFGVMKLKKCYVLNDCKKDSDCEKKSSQRQIPLRETFSIFNPFREKCNKSTLGTDFVVLWVTKKAIQYIDLMRSFLDRYKFISIDWPFYKEYCHFANVELTQNLFNFINKKRQLRYFAWKQLWKLRSISSSFFKRSDLTQMLMLTILGRKRKQFC